MARMNFSIRGTLIAGLASMICLSAAAAGVDNVVGIVNAGSPVPDAGLDLDGYAYAANLLGTSITWSGSTFTLGAPGVLDAMSDVTVPLPAGNDSALNILAAAVWGDQLDQTFVVTYTDGSTTSVTQSVSDWCNGASYAGETQVVSMPYRIAATGATNERPVYLYGYSLAVDSAKTVQSITLPQNRNVVVLGIAAVAAGPDNVVGIGTNGAAVPDGGLDGLGNVYSVTPLGKSIVWAGSTFTFGAPDVLDAVSGGTVSLSGSGSTLNLLATGVDGNQANQTFVVTYTDGTTASFKQSLSDWFTPQNYAGESKVSQMAYRLSSSGAAQDLTMYLYGYSFAIDSAKTVKSITLPANRDVVVLASSISKTSSVPFVAAAPSLSPAPGTYTAAQTVKLSDSTSQALIYYTTNGATPTTSSSLYTAGTPIEISSTTTVKAIAVASGYTSSAVTTGTFTISVPTTLKISGTPSTAAEVGEFYSFTPTVVASSGSTLTYAVANRPAWATFSTATGTLSGTPSASSAGTDANIAISVSNGKQSAALAAFSIDVAAAVASDSGTVTLSWTEPTKNTNGTPLTNLAGYTVHYGTNTSALSKQLSVSSATTTDAEIGNLTAGTWYFEVAAVNTMGIESQFTSAVSKTVP
jgi:hypothetical protein